MSAPAKAPAGAAPAGPLTIGSLCTGYGGLDLAVMTVTGARLAWTAETDPHASAVLARHWPGTPNLGDLTALDWASVPHVDMVTAGWPCQDISYAGAGAGIMEVVLCARSDRTCSRVTTAPRICRISCSRVLTAPGAGRAGLSLGGI